MSKLITKKEAEEIFKRDYLPEIQALEAHGSGRVDNVMRRSAWNDMVNSLCKAGHVSYGQAFNWANPYDK